MIDYVVVLTANYSDKQWTIASNDYTTLNWISAGVPPTQAELDAQWPAVEYSNQCITVQNTRHKDYIRSTDPIFFEWQRGTNTQAAWEAAVQAVKDANPYPPNPAR